MCGNERYKLPTVYFVGGGTEELVVHTYVPSRAYQFNLTGCDCRFSLIDHAGQDATDGTPLLTKRMMPELSVDEQILSVLRVKLEPEDTVGLYGRYIYQISIRDVYGDMEPPAQGVFYIYNNIDKSFVQE